MKFILAFLECLFGLALFLFFLWVEIFAGRDNAAKVSERLWPYFIVSVVMVVWQIVAVLIMKDAIKRGNRK